MVEMDGAVGVGGGGGGQATPAQPHPRLWRLVDERSDLRAMESDYVRRFHRHEPRDHQCSSAVAKHIKAPVHLVSASETFPFLMLLSKIYLGRCCFLYFLAPGSRRVDPPRGCRRADRCLEGLNLYSASNFNTDGGSGGDMLHLDSTPLDVWSLVRRFDQPQLFKPFVSRCEMKGNIEIGSVREVNVKSGLPATRSTERLELLDDNEHILSVRFVGGDHRLQAFLGYNASALANRNYSSILTVHPEVIDSRPGTLVIESFVVDVPDGNTKDETCYFVEALLKCNLKSLAEVSENRVTGDQTEPLDR
ncbi:hypothetical protein HU200_067307 [Digitaria exilis]|uniref:Uncharacterized protein n=1 Tax=Digitaria exilis TaxID=1010633 RepID=A0A834ZVF8_9POAL|nr:hypothetical protein HU200_067307 [Digitaria exilis]